MHITSRFPSKYQWHPWRRPSPICCSVYVSTRVSWGPKWDSCRCQGWTNEDNGVPQLHALTLSLSISQEAKKWQELFDPLNSEWR